VEQESSPIVGEVDVLRMVTNCFNKYDTINVTGQRIDNIEHDPPEDAPAEDPSMGHGLPVQDIDNVNDGVDANNDPVEREGTSTNVKDPVGVDMNVLLREAQTPLYAGSIANRLMSTLMLLVSCTTYGVPNRFVDELLKLLKKTILSETSYSLFWEFGDLPK